jgi:hypothetical protein
MNLQLKNKLIALMLLFGTTTSIYGQENRTKWSLEIDPVTFAFGGYSAHLRLQPKNSKHLLIGAGTYAMNLPSVLVEMNKDNKGKSWESRINQAYGLFGEYYFTETNRKLFLGGQVSIQEFKASKASIEGSTTYTNLIAMAYVGYSWQPFDLNLYIKPWAGIGYTGRVSGSNALGNDTYHIAPISAFATLHIGYTF